MIYILDASAMIAYLRCELGGSIVRDLLLDSTSTSLAHAINLCEVYYDFFRAEGESVATAALLDLQTAGIQRRVDISQEFCQMVGTLKATRRRISLADCFAVTLARTTGGILVSSDHHEFDALAESGICSIQFIRWPPAAVS